MFITPHYEMSSGYNQYSWHVTFDYSIIKIKKKIQKWSVLWEPWSALYSLGYTFGVIMALTNSIHPQVGSLMTQFSVTLFIAIIASDIYTHYHIRRSWDKHFWYFVDSMLLRINSSSILCHISLEQKSFRNLEISRCPLYLENNVTPTD